MFHLWSLPSLKAEAVREAGRRNALKFGPLPADELRQISNANKSELVQALTSRMEWRVQLGQDPEWKTIRPGITPEKKKAHSEKALAAATRRARGGPPRAGSSQAYCCRLACLAVHPDFYGDYLCFRGGGEGISRGEQDAKQMGPKHRFFVKVARAMATPNWRDSNGRPLSVPNDHANDERASDRLKSLLKSLDLEGAAVSLHQELDTLFRGNEDVFFVDVQQRCFKWLKDIRSQHTVSLAVLQEFNLYVGSLFCRG